MTPRRAHLQIVTARRQGRLGQPCRSHDILLGVALRLRYRVVAMVHKLP